MEKVGDRKLGRLGSKKLSEFLKGSKRRRERGLGEARWAIKGWVMRRREEEMGI